MEIIENKFPANVPGMKLNNGAIMPQLGLFNQTYDQIVNWFSGYELID